MAWSSVTDRQSAVSHLYDLTFVLADAEALFVD